MTVANADAVVFDFDGVLVESAELKTQAFAAIYRPYGASVAEQAVAYHVAHAGLSRLVKFRHLHWTLLGRDLSGPELAALDAEFARHVVESVVAAPWVAGAREFVEAHQSAVALFIASGTPEDELKMVVARRGMQNYFRSVHGSPASKGEIIAAIIRRHRYQPERVLMVGDSMTDYEGAMEAGVRFLGVAPAGRHPFPASAAVLPDLTGLAGFVGNFGKPLR